MRVICYFGFSPSVSARFVINSEPGCDVWGCDYGGWMHVLQIGSTGVCSRPNPGTLGPLLRYSKEKKTVLFTTNSGKVACIYIYIYIQTRKFVCTSFFRPAKLHSLSKYRSILYTMTHMINNNEFVYGETERFFGNLQTSEVFLQTFILIGV